MTPSTNSSLEAADLHHISGKDYLSMPENTVILDVRPLYELGKLFDSDHVIYCPYDEIEANLELIPKDRDVVVADCVGLRSKEVAALLQKKGFNNIHNLAGGIVDWERDGLPINTDQSRILTGSCMCQLKVRNKRNRRI
ncbi:MAG: rhodanese-like domain-containing protein [Bacteroidales bacterium]|nr:rhodanese-like domain-containing protein [Bacteroidales bacterium]